jgi:hypothetical protein
VVTEEVSMKNLHYGHCTVGVVIAGVVLVAAGVSASSLVLVAAALACPLMMVLMMRAMMGGHAARPADRAGDDEPADHHPAR